MILYKERNVNNPNKERRDLPDSSVSDKEKESLMMKTLENTIPELHEEYDTSKDCTVIDPEDALPEEIFPVFQDQKTILVPKLQTMSAYIKFHYKRSLTKKLCQWIACGGNGRWNMESVPEAEPETVQLGTIDFWRASSATLLADVQISVTVCYPGNYRKTMRFIAAMQFDMTDGIAFAEQDFSEYGDRLPREDCCRLSKHLIPIYTKEALEKEAESLLQLYNHDGWENQKENEPEKLAEALGLSVVKLPLHNYGKTKSILFFKQGKILTDVLNEEGMVVDTAMVAVSKKTIVINTNAVHKDHCKLDIFHECVHYHWHYMFFRLQDLYNNDLRNIRKIRKVRIAAAEKRSRFSDDPISWLEYQATRGSFAIWMPAPFMRRQIAERWKILSGMNLHPGAIYDRIARGIAKEFNLPKFRVRARLIQLGCWDAMGCLNYTDDHYIAPFSFKHEDKDRNYTYFITRRQAAELYKQDQSFRTILDSQLFIYVDGHLCLNDSDFIRKTPDGLRLTDEAARHVETCCLRFRNQYEQDEYYAYHHGRLYSDEKFNEQYLYFPPQKYSAGKCRPPMEEQQRRNALYQARLPSAFPDMLVKLMEDCNITVEKLSELTDISTRTINDLRNNYNKSYSIDKIMLIIVAMHLPPWISFRLLSAAGIDLGGNPGLYDYNMIVICMWMDDVETIQQHLVTSGLKRFDSAG